MSGPANLSAVIFGPAPAVRPHKYKLYHSKPQLKRPDREDIVSAETSELNCLTFIDGRTCRVSTAHQYTSIACEDLKYHGVHGGTQRSAGSLSLWLNRRSLTNDQTVH